MTDLIGGATDTPATGTPATGTPATGPEISYPEGFAEEFHNDPNIMKFYDKESNSFNQANMMTSLIHAQKMIGGNKVMVPSKDATQDDWDKVNIALGLPERDKYELGLEGVDDNDPMTKGFIDAAHKAGIRPSQAKEIVSYFNEAQKGMDTQSSEEASAVAQVAVEKLKSDWGESYDSNLAVVNETVSSMFSEEEATMAKEAGYFADPTFIRLMNTVGSKMLDDTTLEGTRTTATGFSNADDIRNEYQSLMENPQLKTSQSLQKKQMFLLEQATKKGIQLY
jgi:hypothetical protein